MSLQEPSRNSFPPQSSENSARKRPISERRIQANRRNALRSTGPKTTRGKRTVARNAIKHGLLSREVVITAGAGEETLEEFDALADRLCEYYEPVGVVEESLVQTIATCWWRKARVIRAENGEIRRRLDTLGYCYPGPSEAKVDGQPPDRTEDIQASKKWSDIVGVIDNRLERVFEAYALKRGRLALDARARSFSLPPAGATDKLLRYEAHLDRQLYRAMDQLERLQRQRKGESVPPPLNINLSNRRS